MKKVLFGLAGLLTPASAFAAIDLTGVTVDVATVETLIGIVLAGLVVIWGVRKVIKTVNRS